MINENKDIDDNTKKFDIPLLKTSRTNLKTSSSIYSKFWKSKENNSSLNSNPYTCEYHDYPPRKPEDHILPTIMPKRIKQKTKQSKCRCYCCKRKPSKKRIQRECNKNIINEVPRDTVMVMEGENKITKIVKVNGMKFNVAFTGRKKGSKVLHKIKILMLKRRMNLQNARLKDDKLNKNKIHKEKKNSCCWFGHSKTKSIANNEVSLSSKNILESNNMSGTIPKTNGIESN